MAHNLEYICGPHHPQEAEEVVPVYNSNPLMDAFGDDFGLLSVQDSIHAPRTASVHQGTIGALTPRWSVRSSALDQGPPVQDIEGAFALAQNQSNTVCRASQLGPPIQSPLAVQWAFPPNPQGRGFGLACQQIAATMVQTGVWSAEMAGRYLREAQRVQADALQAGDAASLHSQHSVHASASPAPSRFRPVENWVRSVHMGSPGQSVHGPRPLPTPPVAPSPARTRQTNLFLPGYTPPVLTPLVQTFAQAAALVPPLEAPRTVHMNTWGAAPLQGTSQWDAYSVLPEPRPDPATNRRLKLYIDDNSPLLFSDSKKVGVAVSMIRGKAVDSWVTAFTREHYLGGQWWISWSRFVWELHQKFDDPDLEKKAAVAAEKLTMTAGKGEDYFQELKRLLTEAKYDRENQVVHQWITSAIPKDIYNAVHQAFVAATVNDKSQRGYNIKIPEDYESWKQAILHTDNAMR
ncbi:hypothetical protein WOLCODRAFT_156645 [Wolfiporia cocos MD-104 SS10]|uniref:Retrotransposon gag domain-containing protein n=1 Tax=Wolfiporia cocos (strain MD-104) TaxID=742152 RepID=A0A2H3JAZ8_WOLCO|nr:hypothetical protein WOLCODRAFT_156645 [Wolfiporia cocos MD-104 SS10]